MTDEDRELSLTDGPVTDLQATHVRSTSRRPGLVFFPGSRSRSDNDQLNLAIINNRHTKD